MFTIIGLYSCFCNRQRACNAEECYWRLNQWLTSVEVFSTNRLHEEELEATVPVFPPSAPPIAPGIYINYYV